MNLSSDDNHTSGTKPDIIALGLALLASIALIWLASHSWLAVAAYGGGITLMGGLIWLLVKRSSSRTPLAEQPLFDWSVTTMALEHEQTAYAITDRANRLICTNSAYAERHSHEDAPVALPLGDEARAALAAAARAAWRDGQSQIENIDCGDALCRVEVNRAGRAENYLVWRFISQLNTNHHALATQLIDGSLGRTLSGAGAETLLVDAKGIILGSTSGFAQRAAGDANATMAGQDFAALLRMDDRGRIYYSREGQAGAPQMLVHIPLDDTTAEPAKTGPERYARANQAGISPTDTPPESASLLFVLDSGAVMGGAGDLAAQASMPRLEQLLAQLPLGLAMVDRDGRFLFANPAFARAVDVEGTNLPPYPSDLVISEDKSALSDAVRRFAQGSSNSGDMAVRLKSNEREPVSLGLAGVRGLGEAAVLLSLVDSTEETRLKRQVAQATKMQAVGQLAGGVAHDFNNILTAIIGYCDLMLLRHTPGDSDYDDIQQIRANSNRAASLTRQLLAFSRQQTLRPEILQLPDVVSEVSQLLKRLLGERIELEVIHARGLGPVRADPQQLEQVIVNLAVNARDAIQAYARRSGPTGAGRGKLTLSTRPVTAEQVRRMKTGIIPIADYTTLVVEDTGGGIPADMIGKIFEPFFTTKETGKGTGLGLSTVYGIVKQSGGFIFAENIPGRDGKFTGTRFTIYLPVHHGEPVRAVASEPAQVSTWSGGGKLLLVEDEDMVRAVAERSLSRQGYEVIAARDGEEGLAAMHSEGGFDLVISDVVMPGMDGPAMVRQIRNIAPDIPVLFMSGYAEEQLRNEITMSNMYFIAKPFSVQQIVDRVASILAEAKQKAG